MLPNDDQKLSIGAEIFNVCGNNELSIYDLAHTIKTLLKSESEINLLSTPFDRLEFEVARRSGSTTKIEKILGKEKYLSLDNGLKKIISSYTNN